MENSESESDSHSTSDDLESELYSVLHYNSFSGELPAELLEKYNIRRENNEFFISLKKDCRTNPVKPEESSLQHTDDSFERPLTSPTDKETVLPDGECVTSTPRNNATSSRPSEDENVDSTPKCPTPVKELAKPEEDFILVDDSSEDSDVIIEESVQEVTYISSSSSVECLNDSDVNMDGIMLNTVNRKITLFPEAVGVEEKIKVKWRDVSSPSNWTEKMRKYYNRPSKKLKFFDHEKILQEIKEQGPANWEILPEDRFPLFKPAKRCTICRQTDHLMKNCPKRFANCTMCGNPGHIAASCPFRMCLNCGKQSSLFISMCQQCDSVRHKRCDECKQVGHIKSTCPDTWRRYHSTTNGELVQKPDSVNEKLMCCNCGREGHLYENCNNLYWSVYPPSSFLVKNRNEIQPNPGKRKFVEPRSSSRDESLNFQRGPAEYHQRNKKPRWSEPNLNQNHFYNNLPSTPQSSKKKKNKKKKKTKSPHFQNKNNFNMNNTF